MFVVPLSIIDKLMFLFCNFCASEKSRLYISIYPIDLLLLLIDIFSLSFPVRMFAPVDITIGAYGSIFNHFQTSNQKSVLKKGD